MSRPVSKPHLSAADILPEITPALAKSRVLVVEDHPQNRELIVRLLQFAGITADSAPDGEKALEKFQASRFDLVLMDIQLPVMDGCEATQKIRAWESGQGTPLVPIVAISANSREVDRRRALSAGCTMFISKPISPRGLLSRLGKLMQEFEQSA